MNICATVGCDNHTESPYCDRCSEEMAGVPLSRGEAIALLGAGIVESVILISVLLSVFFWGIR